MEKKTTVYNKFRGVDFSVDSSLVDEYRSPYAPNLISDIGGMPEKRLGWRTLFSLDAPVNGLFYGDINGEKVMIAHCGTKLYFTGETAVEIYSGAENARSTGFFMKDKLYILTGGDYLCYDGEEMTEVEDDAYVPTVMISRDPAGGGTIFEPVNLLGAKRIDSFLGDESSLTYQLSASALDSVDKVEVMDSAGEFQEVTTGFSSNLTTGKVTFTAAKPPVVSGVDNVKITFSKTIEGYAERIKNCTISTLYGYGGSNRVFLSGNPDYKAYDWYSEIYKPEYFPDTGYSVVGDDNTAVMGYQKLGKYLIIIKEDNNQDSTIFQRWGELDASGNAAFPTEQGIAGVGAVSRHCFLTLVDEPLFLSKQGIMAVATTNILAERTIKNRSFFVDFELTKEGGLSDACAAVWKGYYILAVSGRAYVLDSRNKSYRKNRTENSGDFVYECYHWTNIPARVFLSIGGELFFGTADGRICKFNTDIETRARWNDDGAAIVCMWSTKNDDDGAAYLYKTMQKKGCSVTIKPYYRSSCEVYISKDGDPEAFIRSHLMDILDFNDIDFERFTFNTNDSPQDVYLKKKIKKYKRLQVIVKNTALSEGFGIFQIAKTYTVGNFAKK